MAHAQVTRTISNQLVAVPGLRRLHVDLDPPTRLGNYIKDPCALPPV
jgi:hypothetical protein